VVHTVNKAGLLSLTGLFVVSLETSEQLLQKITWSKATGQF